MTREEFVRQYALACDIPQHYASLGFLDFGNGWVRVAMPCACGDKGCKGWVMVSAENVDDHLQLNAPEPLRQAYLDAIKERG